MTATLPAADRLAQALGLALAQLPLVAILRGLTPIEAPAIGRLLVDRGWSMIEVPLNSPQPLRSIAMLAAAHPQALIGAGTVLTAAHVREVHAAGGRLVVAPNFDLAVVRQAVELGLVCLPGVATPSEAFAALAAGATGLKLFPAETIGPAGLKAWRAVLPPSTVLLPVGGVAPEHLAVWVAAGASGAGLGSALYRPGQDAATVALQAERFVAAWRAATALASS